MNYQEAVAYILSIPKFTSKNTLEHTREFLRRLGSPCENRKIIHVAGTNGKGSVCAYMQSLLLCEEKKVGFFTSPHLVKMNERIRINGEDVSDAAFLRAFERTKKCVDQMTEDGLYHPTFFEFLFGMGMLVFEEEQVDYVVLETGLGGRLDATNAFRHPYLTIITSISLDHTQYLGSTIAEIASEKAGIIKKGVPVIFDGSVRESGEVICRKASDVGAPCREISKNAFEIREITSKHIAFLSFNAYYEYVTWELANSGCYQAMNAMLALEAFAYIMQDQKIEEKHLARWKAALGSVHWEGRMEEVLPGVFLDGAHNPGAIEAFAESLRMQQDRENGRRVVLFSAVQDKDYENMIGLLCEQVKADTYIVTSIDDARGVDAEELAKVFRRHCGQAVYVERDLGRALARGIEEKGENGRLYCLGSLYLVGMVKELIGGRTDA